MMRSEGYISKNLHICSYLYSAGLKLAGTKKVGAEFFFRFSPKNEAEKLVKAYFADEASVNPRELFARLNDLRDLIFSGGRG